MSNIIAALFFVLGIIVLALGIFAYVKVAENAIHEIEGLLLVLIGVVCVGVTGIVSAIKEGK